MGNMMKKASEIVGHEDGDFQQNLGDICDHVQSAGCSSPEILYTFKKDELKWGKVQRIASKMSGGMEILHPKTLTELSCIAQQ